MSHSAFRNDRIDALRGAAIACVLLLHFALAYGLRKSPLSIVLPAEWIGAIVFNGYAKRTVVAAVA